MYENVRTRQDNSLSRFFVILQQQHVNVKQKLIYVAENVNVNISHDLESFARLERRAQEAHGFSERQQ